METIIRAVENEQNAIITSLGGAERSRFLLKAGLILLSKINQQTSFKRIFHIVAWDANVSKIYNEARALSFNDFGLKVAKLYCSESEENKSDSGEVLQAANLIVCPTKYAFDKDALEKFNLTTDGALVVFDAVPLDSIEGTCCELYEQELADSNSNVIYSPDHIFRQMSEDCWSIILACNKPIDGLEAELGCLFPIVIENLNQSKRDYRVFSSIILEGPQKVRMSLNKRLAGIHDDVGRIIEECASRIDSGGIVVFLPSYGQMIEFHNHWKQSGLFERIGLNYARENRGEGQLKRMLVNLSSSGNKSIALISHRFHQEINFADCVLSSSTRVIISVGLPYPFTNEILTARMKRNDSICIQEQEQNGRLSGARLYKYRALEFLNGLFRRCLDEFRYQDCAFFILDESMGHERNKLSQELGDAHVETLDDCMKRFDAFCQI